jgi:hypothetical protein
MLAAGVAPDDVTFNTLISKSGSEERAAHGGSQEVDTEH